MLKDRNRPIPQSSKHQLVQVFLGAALPTYGRIRPVKAHSYFNPDPSSSGRHYILPLPLVEDLGRLRFGCRWTQPLGNKTLEFGYLLRLDGQERPGPQRNMVIFCERD